MAAVVVVSLFNLAWNADKFVEESRSFGLRAFLWYAIAMSTFSAMLLCICLLYPSLTEAFLNNDFLSNSLKVDLMKLVG